LFPRQEVKSQAGNAKDIEPVSDALPKHPTLLHVIADLQLIKGHPKPFLI
jgi:hypothetical protein